MRIKSILFAIAALTLSLSAAYAQTGSDQSEAAVRNNHSISLTALGIEYGYEQRLGGNWSLIGRAGVVPVGVDLLNDWETFSANFSMAYGITVEPRFYTSLGRRAAAGRPTVNNSSDFVAIRAQALTDGTDPALTLTPMYGIRRHGGKHWYHEFTFGARLMMVDEFGITPHVQYRLGFIF